MKIQIGGYRLKFKKADAAQVLVWLSGIVHTLAPMEKHASASLADNLFLEVSIPAVVKSKNDDGELSRHACFYPESLPDLKAARRNVAAIVRLDRL